MVPDKAVTSESRKRYRAPVALNAATGEWYAEGLSVGNHFQHPVMSR
jgi:hypothetical protein